MAGERVEIEGVVVDVEALTATRIDLEVRLASPTNSGDRVAVYIWEDLVDRPTFTPSDPYRFVGVRGHVGSAGRFVPFR